MFIFHVCAWDLLSRKALLWDFISAEPPSWVKINLKESAVLLEEQGGPDNRFVNRWWKTDL